MPAIEVSGGDVPNVGYVWSSKSGWRTAGSLVKWALRRTTSNGLLSQEEVVSFLKETVAEFGVMGVESREGPCDKSLGDGEWRSDGGLSA